MAAPHKAILSAGLGKYAQFDANAQAHFGAEAGKKAAELLATSVQKAQDAGFDIVTIDINPQDPEDSLSRVFTALRSREFVGVNIGYGLRGHKEHTVLFEEILNGAWSISPGIKIMFSNGPHDVITAIQRNFPEVFSSQSD